VTDPRALRQSKQEQNDGDDTDDDDFASTFAQEVELIDECSDAGLQHTELAVDTEREQHDEE